VKTLDGGKTDWLIGMFYDASMKPATITLHQTLIRLAKGAISAWERWLRSRLDPPDSEKISDR
jgi:hypothetical protein